MYNGFRQSRSIDKAMLLSYVQEDVFDLSDILDIVADTTYD